PLSISLHVLLGLLRESGVPHKVVASAGQYQQSLPATRTYHLVRVRLPSEIELVPEISGHRLMLSIRLMRADAEGRLKPSPEDCAFEIALCA
ncbi:MAG TPA: cell division protein ZapD, partial [Burkholderiaceae bacterium]|nr:cell division protein ZapD [Burkholderiaceae bacterium]